MTRDRLVVAADARLVFDKVRRGIGKTIIGTYRALAVARPHWRFVLFYRDGVNDNPFADLPNVEPRRVDIRGDRFGWWEKIRMPLGTVLSRADVFHAPAGPAPPVTLAPLVATINDLIPLDLHEHDAEVVEWGRRVRRAARQAKVVLTASEHAKRRIVDLFGVPPAKVEVISWAPISGVAGPVDTDAPRRFGVPAGHGHVLHFGMPDPRKNTARTIEAWSRLPAGLRDRFTLLVVGVHGPAIDGFVRQAAKFGVAGSVHVHGYAAEGDVRSLLATATALCYPTTYEGFGLPILDGFAAGVPVLTGNATSLPEVAGDAAVMVNALDTDAIRDGLANLLTDAVLRTELVARGRERLKRYTWERTAEQVAAVFESVARG